MVDILTYLLWFINQLITGGAQPCNHVKLENCGTIMGEVWDNMG